MPPVPDEEVELGGVANNMRGSVVETGEGIGIFL